MRAKLSARTEFKQIEKDPIKLLEAIKQHSLSYETTQYKQKTMLDALRTLVNLRQKDDESILDYLKRHKAAKEVFLSHAGKDFCFGQMLRADPDHDTIMQDLQDAYKNSDDVKLKQATSAMEALKKKSFEQFLAYLYLDNVDRSKYGKLIAGLETQHSLGQDQYPKSVTDAHQVISNHTWDDTYKKKRENQSKQSAKDSKPKENKEDDGIPKMSFAQMMKKNVCYCCGQTHKLADCPQKNTTPKSQWYIQRHPQAQKYNAIWLLKYKVC